MSLEEIIIQGYVVNLLLACLNVFMVLVSVIISILFQDGFSKDLEIEKLQEKIKAKKEKMSFIERHNGLISICFPYAHIIPSYKFLNIAIKSRFNMYKMYKMEAD